MKSTGFYELSITALGLVIQQVSVIIGLPLDISTSNAISHLIVAGITTGLDWLFEGNIFHTGTLYKSFYDVNDSAYEYLFNTNDISIEDNIVSDYILIS